MDHVAKDGSSKVVHECSLPYMGRGVVQGIITDLAIFDVTDTGLVLRAPAKRECRAGASEHGTRL